MSFTQRHSLNTWHEHRLANEGAAQLEGGFYGSEVTQAANAAVACGADIIAADRSKPLSQARLQAAIRHNLDEELSRLEGGMGPHVACMYERFNLCASAITLRMMCYAHRTHFMVHLHQLSTPRSCLA